MEFNVTDFKNEKYVNNMVCLHDILFEAGYFYNVYTGHAESIFPMVPFDQDSFAITLERLFSPCTHSCKIIRSNLQKLISSSEYAVLHDKSIFYCIDYLIKSVIKDNGLAGVCAICNMATKMISRAPDFYIGYIFNRCERAFNKMATDKELAYIHEMYNKMLEVSDVCRISSFITREYWDYENFDELEESLRNITEDYVGVWVVSGYYSELSTSSFMKYIECANEAGIDGDRSDLVADLSINSFGIYDGLKLLMSATDEDIERLKKGGMTEGTLDVLKSFKDKYEETPSLLLSILSIEFDRVKSDRVGDYTDVSEFVMLEALVYAINKDEDDSRYKEYLAIMTYLCVLYNIKFGSVINKLNSDAKKERYIKDLSGIIGNIYYNK